MSLIRVAIGVDYREVTGYHVLCHSIMRRASKPVSFIPIALNNLDGLITRERNPLQSTEFSFSRFLAPYLCNYEGWVIFMDSDIVAIDDIAKLWALRDDRYAVMCVQHDHRPAGEIKFLGAAQTKYEKKNWSSVMMMNCAKCTALTPEYVNTATGLELHRFQWLGNDDLIGAIPPAWNHLVGYSEGALEEQALLHYTEGGPYFKAYENTKWADVWRLEHDHMNRVIEKPLSEHMGK
ncbi:MAG TPA: glycosyltransferase [Pseudomonadales bacterium]|nr:glycosyltransferase [Pseudomonadales bacterium]